MRNINLIISLTLLKFVIIYGKDHNCPNQTLSFTILYETLCPDSRDFLSNLWPVFIKYHTCLNITLVPFGKARIASDKVICQHGTLECWGNKLHSCVLHANSINEYQKMMFVECQMKDLDIIQKKDMSCANSLDINDHIRACMKPEGLGSMYQKVAAGITGQHAFKQVPAIYFENTDNHRVPNFIRRSLCVALEGQEFYPQDFC